jgi:MFS family permease
MANAQTRDRDAELAATGLPETKPRSSGTLLITSAATLLVIMSYTAPMTTLADTAAALGSGVSGQTWILNAMPIGLAALLLVAGSLADDYGRKRTFLVGTAALAVALAVGAAAPGTMLFVVARLVQGAASAAILASSLALIADAFPPGHRRIRATGIWGATFGGGVAVGPVVSGALVALTWSACYWVFAVTAGLIAAAAVPVLDESRSALRHRLDALGLVTLGLGLVALMTALIESRDGWVHTPAAALLAASVLLLALFAASQARRREPLLDLGLFRRPEFLIATFGALVTGIAIIGLMSYLPTVLQQALGLSPLATAGMLAAWSGVSVVVALNARHLGSRLTARHQLAVGLLVAATGTLALIGSVGAGSWVRLIPGLVVAGAGSGLVNSALPRLAVDSVPADRAAMGSGANSTARYIGSSLGVTAMIAIMNAAPTRSGDVHALGREANVALVGAAGLALVGAALSLILRESRARRT